MPGFGPSRRERAENVVAAMSSPPLPIQRSQNAATIMRAGRPPAARPALRYLCTTMLPLAMACGFAESISSEAPILLSYTMALVATSQILIRN